VDIADSLIEEIRVAKCVRLLFSVR